jgi:hypothetical protein
MIGKPNNSKILCFHGVVFISTYGGFPLEAIMPHMEVEVIFRNLM